MNISGILVVAAVEEALLAQLLVELVVVDLVAPQLKEQME